jgi:hypothetical protein
LNPQLQRQNQWNCNSEISLQKTSCKSFCVFEFRRDPTPEHARLQEQQAAQKHTTETPIQKEQDLLF